MEQVVAIQQYAHSGSILLLYYADLMTDFRPHTRQEWAIAVM